MFVVCIMYKDHKHRLSKVHTRQMLTPDCGGEHDRAIVVSYVHEYVRIRMYGCESQE